MRTPIAALLAALLTCVPARGDDPGPVVATITSTMPTKGDQVRQLAFDGDPATAFVADRPPKADDSITLTFDRPVAVASVRVTSGSTDEADPLRAGSLEGSEDGTTFTLLAPIARGSTFAEPKGRAYKAFRIRVDPGGERPVTLAEIAIASDPPVAPFRNPVEFVVDVADAPEMQEWADRAASACGRAYPMLCDALRSDGYRPARLIRMTLRTRYRGVAATSGNRIVGSVAFFKAHPDDIGAMIHETVHVIQHYTGRGNPGWMVEGVADYVRFFLYEPGKIGPINPDRSHYNGSYRTTAAFLKYLTDRFDKEIVLKLNRRMREGTYRDDTLKELTGKAPEDLDAEWRATLKP